MALLTVAELRQHLETDLSDQALQRLLDDADAEVVRRYGPHPPGPAVETHVGGNKYVFLRQRAAAIQSVTETVRNVTTVLSSDDYRVLGGGRYLERLTSGPNPRVYWGDFVTVTFEPYDDRPQRRRVIIDLVRLALEYNALESVDVGDYSASSLDYQRERRRLLAELSRGITLS